MRPRYSFSSRRNRRIDKIKKQRQKYPDILKKIVDTSDIILEILDARFPEKTRNKEVEKEISKQNKKLIYVLNKADLVGKTKIQGYNYLIPNIIISCKDRKGIKRLRNLIKIISKTIDKKEKKSIKGEKIIESDGDQRIKVGVIGYPNTGKSSLLNILVGKRSAGVGSEAGFTKGLQKIKLTEEIVLIDSPGVIPQEEYSQTEKQKIAQHTIVGGRSYTQVKDPEIVVHSLMKEFPGVLEAYYKISAENDSEKLIEKLGKTKGFLKKAGKVDEDKTARFILKEWQEGKIKV